jgi:4-hydroxybenzoate polyprenyltransferase
VADGVARHLELFSEVHASDGQINLKGPAKADRLVERFGERGFDYLGDSRADEPIWTRAAERFTIRAQPPTVPRLRVISVSKARGLATLVRLTKALRPHQWVKNLLLFVPTIAAHRFAWQDLFAATIAFVCVSLVASGGYVFNDLLDLSSDRRHPRKRLRPFAAGHVSIPMGLATVGVAWAIGFGLAALLLPAAFVIILAVYLAASVSYSVRLKREPILDVMFLAGLYVVRVVAGGLATSVPVSTWLLAFTLFVCLSLAFLKRFIELLAHGSDRELPGRGYVSGDAVWLQSAGLISAYLSVVVLAIYVNNPEVTRLYAHPERLLLLCPVILYWATRTWFLAARGRLHDDPVVAVAADRLTPVIAVLSVLVLVLAK